MVVYQRMNWDMWNLSTIRVITRYLTLNGCVVYLLHVLRLITDRADPVARAEKGW